MPVHNLAAVVDVDLVTIFRRKPLASQPKPRVDANPLVSNNHGVRSRLVGNVQTFLGKSMNTSRPRRAETSSELGITINP